MSLYKDATLAMIPTAYKDGKLYSVRPTDGSGDFTFSRGTTATRVASSGYIEKGRENLLLQSNAFNTTWVNSNSTETGGQSGYNGSSDAWQLTASSAGFAYLQQSNTQSGVQTFSVYAKAGTADHLQVYITGTDSSHYFDLTNGTASTPTGAGAVDSSIENIGSGWYRCSCVCSGTNATLRLYIRQGVNVNPSAGEYIYIQDAQLEAGLVATDYIETTTTSVSAGILEDMPRLDYSGGASCPALLLEPQRTNLLAYSEYLEGSGWNKSNAGTGSSPVISTNTNETTSPEGEYNATKIVFDAGSGTTTGDLSLLEGVVAIAAGTEASTSIWLKGENGGEQLHMRGVANSAFQIITLTTEWQQFTTSENSSTTTDSLQFGIRQNVSGLGVINSSATIYAYGAQIEVGSYPTSYIPTYGASVTRSVDAATKTLGASYFPTNGISAFVDFDVTYSSVTNFADLYQLAGSSTQLRLETRTNGRIYIQQGNMVTSGDNFNAYNLCPSTAKKICLTFSPTQVKAYVDGALINTWDGSYTWDFTDLNMAMQSSTAAYNNTMLFPTTLTDSECIALTTL